jgi:hypothetical protein
MSTFDKSYKNIVVTKPERPKGQARRIRVGDQNISAEQLEFLADIPVLNQAYSDDDWAWLVKYKGTNYILYTNSTFPMLNKDVDGFLSELRKRYNDAIEAVMVAQGRARLQSTDTITTLLPPDSL